MKIKKMSSLFIIAYVCISCVSLKGNHYYNCNSNFPLNMVYLDDSTSIMYYANSIPVSKIHYVVDSLCKSSRKRQTCTINKVDIMDYCIYDYLNKRLPREGTIRNQLICEGDKIMILNDYLVFMNDNHILYLIFYSKSKKKKVIKYSKNLCRGLVFNKYQGDGENWYITTFTRKRNHKGSPVSIVEALNVKEMVMKKGLVLNKSYDIFYLGEDISKYEKYVRYKNHFDDPCGFDSYDVEIHGYSIILWSENGHIEQICCYESCIYNGEELIMMKFEDFLSRIKEEPSNHDICYVPCKDNWGQNWHVYDFDKSGLQIWVWRGRVRSIVIYDTNADEETPWFINWLRNYGFKF